MNASETYYTSFLGRNVNLYDLNRRLVRKFTVAADVINAQVSGYGKDAKVAITMVNGKTYIYRSDGTLYRK